MEQKTDVKNLDESQYPSNLITNNVVNKKVVKTAKKILSKHKYAFEVLGDVKNS